VRGGGVGISLAVLAAGAPRNCRVPRASRRARQQLRARSTPTPPPAPATRAAAVRSPVSAPRPRRARRAGAPSRRPRSSRARMQLRGDATTYESRVERGPGAEAVSLPASPPRGRARSRPARGRCAAPTPLSPAWAAVWSGGLDRAAHPTPL